MSKSESYKHPANPERNAAMVGIRRSNASGTHAQGTPRERSRKDGKRAAIRRSREDW